MMAAFQPLGDVILRSLSAEADQCIAVHCRKTRVDSTMGMVVVEFCDGCSGWPPTAMTNLVRNRSRLLLGDSHAHA